MCSGMSNNMSAITCQINEKADEISNETPDEWNGIFNALNKLKNFTDSHIDVSILVKILECSK